MKQFRPNVRIYHMKFQQFLYGTYKKNFKLNIFLNVVFCRELDPYYKSNVLKVTLSSTKHTFFSTLFGRVGNTAFSASAASRVLMG